MEKKRDGGKARVPLRTRSRVIAPTRMTPRAETGLTHWSMRTLAACLKRAEGIKASFHYIARVWREENLKPFRSGTIELSRDPAFAENAVRAAPTGACW
ncbi:hypothetical protein [Streptomyces olivochromogenes]|uniref:hypothetical protein n=1 Tax=Streptomyces olivochromogenes TaxID=1963 RepID=UPI001F1A420B|nr:hypothetical protein [Streptomyces olivochromogenes]MCF3132775.1 helix-turn-helix domain-containing protein [Streptomyces olivochromogenes]